jgi:hypothetical protein
VPAGFGQEVKSESANRSELEAALGFEAMPSAGTMPGGWGGGPPGTIFADEKLVHGSHHSARLERNSESSGNFSSIVKSIPMNFSGMTLELKGFLRTEDVSGFVGLWMREDGDTPTSPLTTWRSVS